MERQNVQQQAEKEQRQGPGAHQRRNQDKIPLS